MRDTSDKITGDEFSAQTFNQSNTELENIVKSADITLDDEAGPDSDLNMLGKAMAAYSAAGLVYDDTGSASTYILTKPTPLNPIKKYYDGLLILFKAATASSGGSDTVNIESLGAKNLKKPDGTALDLDSIQTGGLYFIIYNESSTRFELVNPNIFATSAEAQAQTIEDRGITPASLGAVGQVGNIDRWADAISVPSGFLECDASAVSRTTYSALFGIIGTTFGVGDGSTTFNLPDIDTIDGGNSEDLIAIIKT